MAGLRRTDCQKDNNKSLKFSFLRCRWSCERRGVDVKDDANLFYADPLCQDVFHNFLATIVARQNTETGVLYR